MTAVFLFILIASALTHWLGSTRWIVVACVAALIYLFPMPAFLILLLGAIALFLITHH